MAPDAPIISVSQFVALLNQTFEYAFPGVAIGGEIANFRVSKNRWVYFDLKDESASVKCFATIYQLPGPLENGMLVTVTGNPKLHNLYGFSLNAESIQPTGEGAIRRAQELLQAKLQAEGLFAPERKRPLPYPPAHIGLITSGQSAAFADFKKVLNARYGGVAIDFIDVQVQGEAAIMQVVRAIEHFNSLSQPPEVLILIRGGGSADDLAAFSTEQVTRAVAASRIPTMVAIGHEVDVSLAELAADKRASTPSNAAELLVPDKVALQHQLSTTKRQLHDAVVALVQDQRLMLSDNVVELHDVTARLLRDKRSELLSAQHILKAMSPESILKRGYAVVRQGRTIVKRAEDLKTSGSIAVQLSDAVVTLDYVKKEQA